MNANQMASLLAKLGERIENFKQQTGGFIEFKKLS